MTGRWIGGLEVVDMEVQVRVVELRADLVGPNRLHASPPVADDPILVVDDPRRGGIVRKRQALDTPLNDHQQPLREQPYYRMVLRVLSRVDKASDQCILP